MTPRIPLIAALSCLAVGSFATASGVAPAALGAWPASVAAANDLGGIDPKRALAALHELRRQAVASGDIQLRWAVDEAECRFVDDLDVGAADEVARAGLQAFTLSADAPPALRASRLRLLVCHAGRLIELSRTAEGEQLLDEVLAAATAPEFAGARALALLERGTDRSRNGDLLRAQADLLEACATLTRIGWRAEDRNCMERVANLYARVGDFTRGLRYYQQLLDAANARGATYDQAILRYNIARLEQFRGDPARAIEGFRRALALETSLKSPLGVAYNNAGIGMALLDQGQPAAALIYLRRAEPEFARLGGRIVENTRVKMAQALAATGAPAEALALLDRAEPDVRLHGDDAVLENLLDARATAQAGLDQWQNAYRALRERYEVTGRINARRQSEQAARLRLQFDSEKDEAQLRALESLNAKERTLRKVQAIALALALVLLIGTGIYAIRKWRQSRHLRALAMIDDLTRVANRRAIMELGEDLLRKSRHDGADLSALVMDIDHFKQINDRLGHAAGDRVLQHVARSLRESLRPRDGLGRIGGEEFVGLLPDASDEDAFRIAERVRADIEARPAAASGSTVPVTISIGVAVARRGESLTRLIERADHALYRAKAAGRNRVTLAGDASASGRWLAMKLETPVEATATIPPSDQPALNRSSEKEAGAGTR